MSGIELDVTAGWRFGSGTLPVVGDESAAQRRARLSDDEKRVFHDLRARVDAGRQPAADVPPVLSSELSPDDVDEAWEAALEEPVVDRVEPASAPVGTAPPGLAPATLWRRAAAAVLDAGCSLVVVGLVAVVSEVLWLRSGGRVSAPVPALAALLVLAGWVHAFVGEALSGGATLGKRALGLRVVDHGGEAPAVWRVVVRRLVLDAQALVVAALALWLTMVRQHGGRADESAVALDLSDATVFLAFLLNLVVLVVLLRHFDPQRRFLHDRLAGLHVVWPEGAGGQAALRPGGRRVAAPVGGRSVVWDDEAVGVVAPRPWEGVEWRPDPGAAAAAAARRRERRGRFAHLVDRVVGWAEGKKPADPARASGAPAPPAAAVGARPLPGVVARSVDRVVAWCEGEQTRPAPEKPDGS